MRRLCAAALALALLLGGCAGRRGLEDGYYSAVADDYDIYGWREYVTVFINGGVLAGVEFNAFNMSGLIKSWDMEYMREMEAETGTYPNEYTRQYAASLLAGDGVDAISGATHSYNSFLLLSSAALDLARAGNTNVAQVTLPVYEEEDAE